MKMIEENSPNVAFPKGLVKLFCREILSVQLQKVMIVMNTLV